MTFTTVWKEGFAVSTCRHHGRQQLLYVYDWLLQYGLST